MPRYTYKRLDNDESVTLLMEMSEMTARQKVAQAAGERAAGDKGPFILIGDHVLARRDFRAELVNTRPAANYPMESDAAGVHPDQRVEAEAHSRSIGIPTHFTEDGAAVFTDPKHRKRYCEAIGMYDRNAGPGDPVPSNR